MSVLNLLSLTIPKPLKPQTLSFTKTLSSSCNSLLIQNPSPNFPYKPTQIRMGGGPRTYPGGVSKWQWKRMQSKKSKQLLKARLARERQIYEMRKRAELKAAVSELERPWEVVEKPPNLFSVGADEQLRVLADRFQKPGGLDLWCDHDGPELFRNDNGMPSLRFFPKGVVHSVKAYGNGGGFSEDEEGVEGCFGDLSRRDRFDEGRDVGLESDGREGESGNLGIEKVRKKENGVRSVGREGYFGESRSDHSGSFDKGRLRRFGSGGKNVESGDFVRKNGNGVVSGDGGRSVEREGYFRESRSGSRVNKGTQSLERIQKQGESGDFYKENGNRRMYNSSDLEGKNSGSEKGYFGESRSGSRVNEGSESLKRVQKQGGSGNFYKEGVKKNGNRRMYNSSDSERKNSGNEMRLESRNGSRVIKGSKSLENVEKQSVDFYKERVKKNGNGLISGGDGERRGGYFEKSRSVSRVNKGSKSLESVGKEGQSGAFYKERVKKKGDRKLYNSSDSGEKNENTNPDVFEMNLLNDGSYGF